MWNFDLKIILVLIKKNSKSTIVSNINTNTTTTAQTKLSGGNLSQRKRRLRDVQTPEVGR